MPTQNLLRSSITLLLYGLMCVSVSAQTSKRQDLEIYSIRIRGVEELYISDLRGNRNDKISAFLQKAVPGVDYEFGSNSESKYIFPHEARFAAIGTYDIKFVTTAKRWSAIEITRGGDDDVHSLVVRYLDFRELGIEPGVKAWLRFTPSGVSDLRCDNDGNGTFETSIKPQFQVTGRAALDNKEPHVVIQSEVLGTTATVTITATDEGTGIKNLRYQTDDSKEVKPYTGPFTLDISRPRAVLAIVDDRAGNRTETARDFNLDPTRYGPDPFKLRSVP